METRNLEINVISARDLNDVNIVTKMDVYVVVSLTGDSKRNHKAKTSVDREGGKNPSWNSTMKFIIDEGAVQSNRLTLVFKLCCERALGDKDIGEVHVPVNELLNSHTDGTSMRHVSYQVRRPSGKPQGILDFSFKFSEKPSVTMTPSTSKVDEPVTSYPARPVAGPHSVTYGGIYPPPSESYPPPPQTQYHTAPERYPSSPKGYPAAPEGYPLTKGYNHAAPEGSLSAQKGYHTAPEGYPPQQPVGGYGYYSSSAPYQPPSYPHPYMSPRAPTYGYPPQYQQGYGYAPPPPTYMYGQPVQKPKKKKSGLGLGAGLLGGVVGGLLLGGLTSDSLGSFDPTASFDPSSVDLSSYEDSIDLMGTIG